MEWPPAWARAQNDLWHMSTLQETDATPGTDTPPPTLAFG
jgi:hypothetical protein